MLYRNSGNVLFIIFIGIALFGALSYALISSSTKGGNLDNEQAAVASSQIMQIISTVRGAVGRLRLAGCASTQISFDGIELSANATDPHTATPADGSCEVKNITGVPNIDSAWLVSSHSDKNSYGSVDFHRNFSPVGDNVTSYNEVWMIIPYVNDNVCEHFNKKVFGQASIPTNTSGIVNNYQSFTGTFINGAGQLQCQVTYLPATNQCGAEVGCVKVNQYDDYGSAPMTSSSNVNLLYALVLRK